MTYDELLKIHGSFRKAAIAINSTKSKFMRLWKIELGLCHRRTSCKNNPEVGKTACKVCLEYVGITRDPIKRKNAMKIWSDKNKEKLKRYGKEYQLKNLHKHREYSKKYRNTEKGKALNNEKRAFRRALKKQATPIWVDRKALKQVYKNCPEGYHVDHMIPLQHDQVCGLHVPWNMQYLTAFENDSKFNKFDGTYDNNSWRIETCHQYRRRLETEKEDKEFGMPFDLKVSDFTFQNENMSIEIKKFIERYEWLGKVGWGVKWAFTARYKDALAGVVLISEPTAYSRFSSIKKDSEAMIQRGASSSWAPKNLNSALVMYSCRWMVNNTNKRIFSGYSDPDAGEVGIIYQACNFDFLGQKFGNKELYILSSGKKVGGRYFTRTSSMKSWAKELGIGWQKEWLKPNGYQDISKIPIDIKVKLMEYSRYKKNACQIEHRTAKGKYVLILGKDRRDQKELDKLKANYKTYPYPKRSR